MKRHSEKIVTGTNHISATDPVMRHLVARCPSLTSLELQSNRFASLVNAILSQQLSTHAARTIRSRLMELTGADGLTANRISQLQSRQLRSVGISRAKVACLHDLSGYVVSGRLRLDQIGRCSDSGVIEQLTEVKGIGVWTAQMFLIFSLGRLDVFPHDDYGVRSAIQKLYGLETLPGRNTSARIAEPWGPYRTIASWYCWRSHELKSDTSGGL